MGKVNTTKELENSWIRWSSLVALLSFVLKEAIKRFSSRSCWIIFFRCYWQESTHFPLLTAEKGWLSALCYQSSFCFVLFYLQLFILLLTQLASEYRLAEYTALFSSRSGCIQALENTEKKIKQKYYNDEIEEIFTTIYVVKYTVPFEFAYNCWTILIVLITITTRCS